MIGLLRAPKAFKADLLGEDFIRHNSAILEIFACTALTSTTEIWLVRFQTS